MQQAIRALIAPGPACSIQKQCAPLNHLYHSRVLKHFSVQELLIQATRVEFEI